MKKILSSLRFVLLASVFLTSAVTTRADDGIRTAVGGIEYEIRYTGEGYDAKSLYAILCYETNDNVITRLDAIPEAVTGKYEFYNNGELCSCYLTAFVTTIGKFAFNNSPVLSSVTIPEFITVIYSDDDSFYPGHGAFEGCTAITELNWKARNCPTKGRMPSDNIERVTIGSEVTILPDGFVKDSKITEVTIPNSVTTIGSGAFNNCSGLVNVNIPDAVTTIGNYAFEGCSGLTSIDIPNSVDTIGFRAFKDCSGLTSVNISNSITTISELAFYNCSKLTNVIIPNSVTTIDNYAFTYCYGLSSITIPNSVRTIGAGAFSGCSSLTNVSIPNSVNSISTMTFYLCTNLASVIIPYSVTSIAAGAFYGCNKLTEITCYATIPPTVGTNAFINYNATLRVPRESVELYRTTSPWSNFCNIVEVGGNQTGDVNEDGEVTISDVNFLLDFILSGTEYLESADLNNDGEIGISDVNALIEYLLSGGW